ncbi:unnamed protein product [Miscanthus lutarioriparius]|uniref:Uncharacterized protein n=1 Tax=Miscanthus lutarioriparius TaxID=422564 RepID=A0A811RCJ7_9POAL|nr:unnamed protein product [Miscanthus lutarioriparius]
MRSVEFDLAVTGDDVRRGVARVAAAVEGCDVGVLVNNAGASGWLCFCVAVFFRPLENARFGFGTFSLCMTQNIE